jgi:hypothetical protein
MDARIEARAGVRATPDRIWEVLEDLPGWNRWNPHETDVEGRIGFGGSLGYTERLAGERRAQARVVDWQPRAKLILAETRGLWFASTRWYAVEELDAGSCILSTGASFSGLRGELYHDRHRAALRQGFNDIVEALRAAAEG